MDYSQSTRHAYETLNTDASMERRQNPYIDPNSHTPSSDFSTVKQSGSDWMSLASPDWSPGEPQADPYVTTPVSTPTSAAFKSSWGYFDEGFKNGGPLKDTTSPASDTFRNDLGYSSNIPYTSWDPAWDMQNVTPAHTVAYLPLSTIQGQPLIHDPEGDGEYNGTQQRYLSYSNEGPSASSSTVVSAESAPKPKWGTSKGPRKKQDSSKSQGAPAHAKSGKKDQRRNSNHSSTPSSSHQLRSTKNAQKLSYAPTSAAASATQTTLNSKASHNQVEKQYRNRLNDQFNTLLSSIPSEVVGQEITGYGQDGSDRRVSKAEVLVLAKRHIETLEKAKEKLEQEKEYLKGSVRKLKGAWVDMGGEILP
ncbi:hypothetical protein G7Y89_g4587 [Cudoniella acicularis]|uniref:BHLH domain-containing protein n=1 Tax=Cudoniella acicularis TaxID=354080 RepID=A0A8H4RS61_9HELO|nr:hypothetical protein G7Y89_g4587 [Cudoniella acicularis]